LALWQHKRNIRDDAIKACIAGFDWLLAWEKCSLNDL